MSIDRSFVGMFMEIHKKYDLHGSMLTLGVQDVLGSHDDIAQVLREADFPFHPIPQEERTYSSSKYQEELSPVLTKKFMHMRDLFRMLRFTSIESIDAFDNESPTILWNLNEPVATKYHDKFDLILDIGVLEHVFDIRQCIENLVNMLKENGVIVFCVPLYGWHNQCFFNLQPPFFFDVFRSNGFSEESMYLHFYPKYGQGRNSKTLWEEFHYDDDAKFRRAFHYTSVLFAARKTAVVDPFVTPLQGYYLRHHSELHEAGREDWIARLYPHLAKVFQHLPNWIRVLILDGIVVRIRRRGARRKKLRF